MLYLWLLMCVAAGWLGRKRRFGFWGFFIVSLVFSPLVVILVLILTHPTLEKKRASGAAP